LLHEAMLLAISFLWSVATKHRLTYNSGVDVRLYAS